MTSIHYLKIKYIIIHLKQLCFLLFFLPVWGRIRLKPIASHPVFSGKAIHSLYLLHPSLTK